MPQKLTIAGSQIIVNDFTGNKLTILDVNPTEDDVNYLSIPSAIDDSVTADFALDANDDIWYTNWLFQQGGFLVKFNQHDYRNDVYDSGEQFLPLIDYISAYALPVQLLTPNGITFSDDGLLWIADTTSHPSLVLNLLLKNLFNMLRLNLCLRHMVTKQVSSNLLYLDLIGLKMIIREDLYLMNKLQIIFL